MAHAEVLNGLDFKSSGKWKWSVLQQNINVVLESICAFYSAPLWLRHNVTSLQAELSDSLCDDELVYWYGYYSSCPHNGQHPTHRPFYWLPSLCLITNAHFAHSAQSLPQLEMTNHQHHWENADTAGRPPADWPDRLLRGSLRPTAHLQWFSRSCCRLINDDRYGVAKQSKITSNTAVSLTESDLRLDHLHSQDSGWKTFVGHSVILS